MRKLDEKTPAVRYSIFQLILNPPEGPHQRRTVDVDLVPTGTSLVDSGLESEFGETQFTGHPGRYAFIERYIILASARH
jgi:hypothetical protein